MISRSSESGIEAVGPDGRRNGEESRRGAVELASLLCLLLASSEFEFARDRMGPRDFRRFVRGRRKAFGAYWREYRGLVFLRFREKCHQTVQTQRYAELGALLLDGLVVTRCLVSLRMCSFVFLQWPVEGAAKAATERISQTMRARAGGLSAA
jgi:hypothetical protein